METKMTFKQYQKEEAEINRKQNILAQERVVLREKYIEDNRQFKNGDKVRVWQSNEGWNSLDTGDKELGVFYIKKVSTIKYTGGIEYQINKIKKDGSLSEQSAGIYYYSRIEKI